MATYGAFETLEQIGQGGMGVVYKARDTRLGRTVALKVLRQGMSQDPVALERHQREAVAAASLNHPNVATIYEVGESPSGPFIAMEYVEGLTLRDVLRSGTVSQGVLLAWASQVADALAAAHAAGIVHRDVKPENIMIAGDHRAVVLDFGIARHVTLGAAEAESRLTMEGGLVGSVHYQAPEVLRGVDVSPASDVFALGAILYEMATGRVPFDGTNTFAILNAIVSDEPTPPSELNPDVGTELEAIIARAMEKDPARRFADASELLAELRRVIGTPSQSIEQLELGAPRTNLPAHVTRFIGRSTELAALGEALTQNRLVTVTGPGGSGKTRLAQELARSRLPEHPGGIWFVELSSASRPAEIAGRIAQALGVRPPAEGALLEAVADALAARDVLLLLDNCEHVIEGAAHAADTLLSRSPTLRVLATSRERLGVAGESVWQIPPLGIPTDEVGDADACEAFEAVQLFCDRAQQSKAGFALNPENGPTIARICRRLDGIPLAIELAAARVSVLGPEQILARLEDRFRLLKSGARSAEPRQQTLRATVEWSVELLTEPERRLFFALSVFRGGAALDSVEEVCGPAVGDDEDVLDLLSRLVDKSLVFTREASDGLRYDQYETLRAYAELALGDERSAALDRHATVFADLAREARPHLTGPDQGRWLARLAEDAANLRHALEHSIAAGDWTRSAEIAASVWRLWFVRGHLDEGRRLLEAALDAVPASWLQDASAEVAGEVAELHLGAGVLANDQGDYAAADRHFERGLEIHRGRGDRAGVAETLNSLGVATRDQGRYEAARGLLEQSLALHRELGDERGVAAALHALGITAHREGDCATARKLFEEALAIRELRQDERGIAALRAHLGSVAYDEGELAAADPQLREALDAFGRLGNVRGSVFARLYLGSVDLRRGSLAAAEEHFADCLRTARDLGDRQHIAVSLERFGLLRAAQGRDAEARQFEAAADRLREEIGAPRPALEAAELQRDLAVLVPHSERVNESASERGRGDVLAVAKAIKVALGR